MKIKFLGTSAGWPLPRLGCNCEICTSKDPKDTRTRTQLLVDDSILVDAGPDTYSHLKNVDTAKLKAVLVSHEHPDHISGFWDITHIYGKDKPLDVFVTLPVLHGIQKTISTHGTKLKINVVKENQQFMIGNTKVLYFPVVHGKTPAFGIKLKSNKIFAYITDFNKILPSSQKFIKGIDCWAIDGSTLGKIGQGPGHISISDGIQIAKKLEIKNTYFIHIGHKTGTHEYLEGYLKENAGPNFQISYDGLEIEI